MSFVTIVKMQFVFLFLTFGIISVTRTSMSPCAPLREKISLSNLTDFIPEKDCFFAKGLVFQCNNEDKGQSDLYITDLEFNHGSSYKTFGSRNSSLAERTNGTVITIFFRLPCYSIYSNYSKFEGFVYNCNLLNLACNSLAWHTDKYAIKEIDFKLRNAIVDTFSDYPRTPKEIPKLFREDKQKPEIPIQIIGFLIVPVVLLLRVGLCIALVNK